MSDKLLSSARWRHDLKNQLGIVLGFSELLLQDAPPDGAAHLDLQEILKAAQQAMKLVENLEELDEPVA